MEGVVTTYLTGVLTVNIDRAVGSGSYLSWKIGIAGDAGADGAVGATGAKGATGATGAAGADGAAGAKGATGATGPTGAAGAKGATGATGATGAAGTNGINGTNGTNGATGATGATGPTGAAGTNGVNGATGATGATGYLSSGASAGNTPYWNGSAWVLNSSNIYNNGGNVGIGNTSAAYKLDVTGTGRFTGALKIGGYTLPSTDGDDGDVLTTNGSGTVSWQAASGGSGSGWTLSGNVAANGSFIGTTNNKPFIIKVNNQQSGYIAASDKNTFLGYNCVYTNGSYNVGIGNAATIYGSVTYSIAIGNSAQVQPGSGSSNDIAIGNGANVTGGSAYSYSTAIGSSAQVQNSNGIAFGRSANVNAQYGMAIGDAAQAQGNSAVVIGKSAYSNAQDGIAIGTSSQAQGSNTIVIGENAYSNSSDAISIGTSAQAQGTNAVVIGKSSYSNSQDAIAIGNHAQAQGSNSIAIGTNLYNGSNNTTAIGNSSVTTTLLNGASSSSYALMVGTNSSNGNGAYLTKGGTWTNASDRNLKEDFTVLNGTDILKKVSQLDITKWKYKGTNEYHIGPMAQDFYALFNVGEDNRRISSIDPSGVALAAIKQLNDLVQEQQTRIDKLTKELEEMKGK